MELGHCCPKTKYLLILGEGSGHLNWWISCQIKCPTVYLLIRYYGFLPLPQRKIGFMRPLPHMNNGMGCQTVANPNLHPLNLMVKIPCKVSMLSTFTHHRVGTQAKASALMRLKKRLYKDGSRKPHKYFYSIRATGIHEGLFSQTIKLSVGRWAIKM